MTGDENEEVEWQIWEGVSSASSSLYMMKFDDKIVASVITSL